MREFARPRHARVWRVLESLDGERLAQTRCFFAGGTRIVLEIDEYRESIDVDFLCSDRAGYRALRSQITQRSFGDLFRDPPDLLREIRADMYGIRTFLDVDGEPLKFELVAEGRIDVGGTDAAGFPVPALDRPSCFAEKLLANADRGRDESTRSRDLVDLAHMVTAWSRDDLARGLSTATDAYGDAVLRELRASLERLEDRGYRRRCTDELSISDPRRLGRGLRTLRELVTGPDRRGTR